MPQIFHYVFEFTLDIPAGQAMTFKWGPYDFLRDSTVQVAAVPRFVRANENAMSVPEVVRYDLLEKNGFFYSQHYIRFDVVNKGYAVLRYFNIVITVTTP